MTPPADAELVERSRQRDATAFGELVERHQRLVFGVALARCKDPALAEDLAQEAFVTAWRDLDRLRDDARVGTWVAGIARNLAASAARDRARHATPPAITPTDVPTPEDAAVAREDSELLARALADIPDAHRETLVLFYLEGESIARIAAALAISEDAVKQRLSRGRRALRDGVARRVESALDRVRTGRVRTGPALRAGVLAALPRIKPAAGTAGKVLAIMTIKKVAIAAVTLAVAGGAVWLGTRDRGDAADANAAVPSTDGNWHAPTATTPGSPHVRKIDAQRRAALLGAIRTARERAATAPVPTSSPSTNTPRPALPANGDDEPTIDKQYIRAAVRELIPMIGDCYEKGLDRNPKLGAGNVTIDFTIEGEPGVGGVIGESKVNAAKTDLPDPIVSECIQETMYALEIDAPANGGVVHVTYPFSFSPAPAPEK